MENLKCCGLSQSDEGSISNVFTMGGFTYFHHLIDIVSSHVSLPPKGGDIHLSNGKAFCTIHNVQVRAKNNKHVYKKPTIMRHNPMF